MSVKITIDYLEDKTINISEQKFGNDSKKKLQSVQKNSTLSFGKSYICFPNLNVFSAPQQISFLKSVHLKNHQEFKEANGIFKACLKEIKREELENETHDPASANSTRRSWRVFFRNLVFFKDRTNGPRS